MGKPLIEAVVDTPVVFKLKEHAGEFYANFQAETGISDVSDVPKDGETKYMYKIWPDGSRETYIQRPDVYRRIEFDLEGKLSTSVRRLAVFGNQEVLTLGKPLSEADVDQSEYMDLPGVYMVPKYLDQKVFPLLSRSEVEGEFEDSYRVEKQRRRWAGMIKEIDRVVAEGVDGKKLRVLEDLACLYMTRLVLMARIKGRSLEEIERMGDDERVEDYFPIESADSEEVVENDGGARWYGFSGDLICATGDQVLGVVIRVENGQVGILCNREKSPRWGGDDVGFAGGGVNEGETVEEALARELREEVGMSVDPQMHVLGGGEVFMETEKMYQPTKGVVAVWAGRVEKSGGDENFPIQTVMSSMDRPSFIDQTVLEKELLEGRMTDGRMGLLLLALVEEATTKQGLVLEDPYEVIRQIELKEEEEMIDMMTKNAGSMGGDVIEQLSGEN